MPALDPTITILDAITYEITQALNANEVGAARALLRLVRVVLVAVEPEPADIISVRRAIAELVEARPELAHVLGELADLVEQLGRDQPCHDPKQPCTACQDGLECPAPGCEGLGPVLDPGDPVWGPW